MPEPDRLTWYCVGCTFPVKEDEEGYICVLYAAIREREEAAAEWKRKHPDSWSELSLPPDLNNLAEYPEPAHWTVWHRECDPSTGDLTESYWFDLDRIRTWPAALEWTLHLMGKRWIEETDWPDFLRDNQPVLNEQP
jgi:hypothetical protein